MTDTSNLPLFISFFFVVTIFADEWLQIDVKKYLLIFVIPEVFFSSVSGLFFLILNDWMFLQVAVFLFV